VAPSLLPKPTASDQAKQVFRPSPASSEIKKVLQQKARRKSYARMLAVALIFIVLVTAALLFNSREEREKLGAKTSDDTSKPAEKSEQNVKDPPAPLAWTAKFYCKTPGKLLCRYFENRQDTMEWSLEKDCVDWAKGIASALDNNAQIAVDYSCSQNRSEIKPFTPTPRF
jgi:hypothetical protein